MKTKTHVATAHKKKKQKLKSGKILLENNWKKVINRQNEKL